MTVSLPVLLLSCGYLWVEPHRALHVERWYVLPHPIHCLPGIGGGGGGGGEGGIGWEGRGGEGRGGEGRGGEDGGRDK